MNTPLSPEKSGVRPFDSDVEYLMAEVDWICKRAERIEAFRLLHAQEDVLPRLVNWRSRSVNVVVNVDRVTRLEAEESALRQEIDARVGVNRTDGPDLGLDRICLKFGLGDVERATLLLGFVSILGSSEFANSVSRIDSVTTCGFLSYELVSEFLELGPEDHLKGLLALLPDATLIVNDLVRLTYSLSTPSDAVSVGIEVTGKALTAITGVPGFEGFTALTT